MPGLQAKSSYLNVFAPDWHWSMLALDSGYSATTHYCGYTSSAYNGAGVGGWSGAGAKCRAVSGCSSTRAYMCSSDALAKHQQDSGTPALPTSGNYWISDQYYTETGGAGYKAGCSGWTTSSTAAPNTGANWTGVANGAGLVTISYCNNNFAIMCCD